ncbi:MAG: hypothetical protein JRH08_05190 [Deltaproteobacteria bacterium]|nr:hypothetical protein [Deltaproteobacteria bacterium]MBW2025057.1 hypothetical protein [Deltaproteobacteria bacterium]MBW2125091.1 hypothetical protein [Deltaproteobacteria bacterium]RLB15621.1 MAG: hypothetical protein DRG63_06590 [Deltaproteobacteria bacterium]
MKITGPHGPHITDGHNRTKAHSGKEGDFKKVMDQVMKNEQMQESSAWATVSSSTKAAEVAAVNPMFTQTPYSPSRVAVNEIERMLGLLDFYGRRLGDQSIHTKDLQPLVEHLEAGVSMLDSLRTKWRLHQGLDSIISDLVATVSSEVERFKRGDYE